MTATFAGYEFKAPALRALIRSAWSVAYDDEAGAMPGVIAPDAHVEFVFQTGAPCGLSFDGRAAAPSPRAMVFALRHGALRLRPSGANTIVAFRVAPAVASAILRRPLVDCWDRPVALEDLIGNEAHALLGRIAATPQSEIGAVLEAWVSERLAGWSADDTRSLQLQYALFWRATHHSMAGLADEFGLTPRTLRRHCERHAGLSPKQVSMSGRILRACIALRGPAPIADVAHRLGFNDQAAFTNAFGSYVTMSPAQFRAEPMVYCEGTDG
jgi:AraC-like DNA-binding protein